MDTIQELINNHFIKMCEQGNLLQVKHWLESDDLQLKADINSENDCAIISA